MTARRQLLTPREVAEVLQVHPQTVYLWLRGGRLPGMKIAGTKWRVDWSALERGIERQEQKPRRPSASRRRARGA